MATFKKDPDATLDFAVDWSAWLLPFADSISTVQWIPSSGLAVESSPAPSNAAGVATAWISGGEPGTEETLVCRMTSAAGRIDDRTLRIKIADR